MIKFPLKRDYLDCCRKWDAFWRRRFKAIARRAFHPSLPQHVNGLATHGAVISDRALMEEYLREAAFVVICDYATSELDSDEGWEDETEAHYYARLSVSRKVQRPQCNIEEQIRGLLGSRPHDEVESAYCEILPHLGRDAVKMGSRKFREFVILMNKHCAWGRYVLALNGHGVDPSDEEEIAFWLGDNEVELFNGYCEIGLDEGFAIASRLIEMELNQNG